MKVRGDQLNEQDQKQVLAEYVHRYTKEHVPQWAKDSEQPKYPVQFESDAEWLHNSFFEVTKSGRLSRKTRHCESTPTWPDNPELKKD